MKANEAPEKIYVYIPDDDIVGTASTQKGFPHQFVTKEYTRTDAFIEKACEWLRLNRENVKTEDNGIIGWIDDIFVDDFKNYMKGE